MILLDSINTIKSILIKKSKKLLTRNDKYGNLTELSSEREITKTTAKNNSKKLLTNDESCDNLI
ncbi:hypothetical protein IMSAGC020_00734 [Lachnospiraceae bacterium]|nr:hypothetical protein IMSAGC020_00734 [Lachnospiraceae bacterium]